MAAKDRNFRSYYYDKVGFRGVDEKKSLEKLISEKPIDKQKLSMFCLKFTIPSIYREYVWKILLGVVSVNSDSHESVMFQRKEHFSDLYESLKVTRKINDSSPEPVVYTLMYLVGQEFLMFDLKTQMAEPYSVKLVAIASAFAKIGSSDVNKFWLFRNFMLYEKKYHTQFKTLIDQMEGLLKKNDPDLHKHLVEVQAIKALPIESWFENYFAEVLHVKALERLWDRIIGGSCKILPYVGVQLLIALRHDILALTDPHAVVQFLAKVQEDVSDMAVSKALDLCHCAA